MHKDYRNIYSRYYNGAGSGKVPIGALNVSISNMGAANGTVNGITILPGATYNFHDPHGGLMPEIPFDTQDQTILVVLAIYPKSNP